MSTWTGTLAAVACFIFRASALSSSEGWAWFVTGPESSLSAQSTGGSADAPLYPGTPLSINCGKNGNNYSW